VALAGKKTGMVSFFRFNPKNQSECSGWRIYAAFIRDPLFLLFLISKRITGCTISLLFVVELLHDAFPLNAQDRWFQRRHANRNLFAIPIETLFSNSP
jgi:hypothetical protein